VPGANRVSEWIAKRGMRSTLLGILVNLVLSVTKVSAGLLGHSFALVADGLESGADVLSGLVVVPDRAVFILGAA
jgi:divalent metal cation (Fe/Co/Zn/Cd) transporter